MVVRDMDSNMPCPSVLNSCLPQTFRMITFQTRSVFSFEHIVWCEHFFENLSSLICKFVFTKKLQRSMNFSLFRLLFPPHFHRLQHLYSPCKCRYSYLPNNMIMSQCAVQIVHFFSLFCCLTYIRLS